MLCYYREIVVCATAHILSIAVLRSYTRRNLNFFLSQIKMYMLVCFCLWRAIYHHVAAAQPIHLSGRTHNMECGWCTAERRRCRWSNSIYVYSITSRPNVSCLCVVKKLCFIVVNLLLDETKTPSSLCRLWITLASRGGGQILKILIDVCVLHALKLHSVF